MNACVHPFAVCRLFSALALSLALLTLLPACSKKTPKTETTISAISGYNYSNEGIQIFYVNGAWGGALGIGEGGGGEVCCVTLPVQWAPGLSATVEWERSDCGLGGPGNERCPSFKHLEVGNKIPDWKMKTLKKVIAIEPYEKGATVQVMFLPDDEVKIFVSSLMATHADHPSRLGRARPLDNPAWKVDE